MEIDARMILRAELRDDLSQQRFLSIDAQSAFKPTAAFCRPAPHHLRVEVDVFAIDAETQRSGRSRRHHPVGGNLRPSARQIEDPYRRMHSEASSHWCGDLVVLA